MLKATTGVPQAWASRPVLGRLSCRGGDHERISSAVKSAQAEDVVQVAGEVNWEAELERRLRLTLAEHHELG